MRDGIPVNENTIKEMALICDEYGVDMEKYLGKITY